MLYSLALDMRRSARLLPPGRFFPFDTVPVDDVRNAETSRSNYVYPPKLWIIVVARDVNLPARVLKDTVTLAFSDIKRLAIARIDEAVNVKS
jgi:hypothetical protein